MATAIKITAAADVFAKVFPELFAPGQGGSAVPATRLLNTIADALDAADRVEWPPEDRRDYHRALVFDLRRARAMRLASEIINTVAKHITRATHTEANERERDVMRDVYRDLFDLLFTKGAEVITDEDRRQAGLPPRNESGMTREEMHALEARRLELMYAPAPPIVA